MLLRPRLSSPFPSTSAATHPQPSTGAEFKCLTLTPPGHGLLSPATLGHRVWAAAAVALKSFATPIHTRAPWGVTGTHLCLAAVPLVALLLLTPIPPAWAETCLRDSKGIYYRDSDDNQIYSKEKCTALTLKNNNLSNLSSEIFKGLHNLQKLRLDGNNLSSLPAGIFDGLSNLEVLSLSRNKLSSLSPEIFEELHNLQKLRLDDNKLSSLSPKIFKGLHNLQNLWLYDNSLSSLPAGIFDGPHHLEILSLSRNKLSSLSSEIFKELHGLQNLWLCNNNLSSLPAGIFDGLHHLEVLSLSRNKLSSLSSEIFKELHGLQKLWLYDNKLTCLPSLPTNLYLTDKDINSIDNHCLQLCPSNPTELESFSPPRCRSHSITAPWLGDLAQPYPRIYQPYIFPP